ncbi:MAG: rRNA maturation RNase YbeY [Oligoflexales bacterium]|nr:rRNA maturation RNase YbeY [Oligoflexales bacterium]
MDGYDQSIYLSIETDSFSLDQDWLAHQAERICQLLKVDHLELSIRFVDQEEIINLNRRFREKDSSTDVLSFPQISWQKQPELGLNEHDFSKNNLNSDSVPTMLGDVVISVIDAQKNATEIGQSLEAEILFLMVHGILHLCGYDHQIPIDEQKMLQQQTMIINSLSSNQQKSAGEPLMQGIN